MADNDVIELFKITTYVQIEKPFEDNSLSVLNVYNNKTLTVTKYDTLTNLPLNIPIFTSDYDGVFDFDPERPSLPLKPMEQEENEDIVPVHGQLLLDAIDTFLQGYNVTYFCFGLDEEKSTDMVISDKYLCLTDSLGWFIYPIFDELPNNILELNLMIKKYELRMSGYIITNNNIIKDLYDVTNTKCHLIESEQFEYDVGDVTSIVVNKYDDYKKVLMKFMKNCPKLNESDTLIIEIKFFQSVGEYEGCDYKDSNKAITISKMLFVFFSDVSQLKYEDNHFAYPDNLNNNFSMFLNSIITATNEVEKLTTPTTSTNLTQNKTDLFPIKLSTVNYRKTALSYLLYSSLYGNTVCYALGMIDKKKVMKSISLLKLLSVMNNYKTYPIVNDSIFIGLHRSFWRRLISLHNRINELTINPPKSNYTETMRELISNHDVLAAINRMVKEINKLNQDIELASKSSNKISKVFKISDDDKTLLKDNISKIFDEIKRLKTQGEMLLRNLEIRKEKLEMKLQEQIDRIGELEKMLKDKNEVVIDKYHSNIEHKDQNKQILEKGKENVVNLMTLLEDNIQLSKELTILDENNRRLKVEAHNSNTKIKALKQYIEFRTKDAELLEKMKDEFKKNQELIAKNKAVERTDRDEMISRQLLVKAEQRCIQLQKDYIKLREEYEDLLSSVQDTFT